MESVPHRHDLTQARFRAVADAVLAATPRFGPGVEMRSLIAAARRRLDPPAAGLFRREVRAATLALEESWRLARVPGAHPSRWRRLEDEDRSQIGMRAQERSVAWPPM